MMGAGKSYGREEFDRWLGRHDVSSSKFGLFRRDFRADAVAIKALVELPGHLFPEELLQAYPDAKIVINDRDVDSKCQKVLAQLSLRPLMLGFKNGYHP